METKLNIAEILKYKPECTKLYSPLFGKCTFLSIYNSQIYISHHTDTVSSFYSNGTYFKFSEAELLLFPSKEMRDWSKFAWKKGDVLVSNDKSTHIVFKGFQDETYKTFIGNYYFENPHYSFLEKIYETKDFCKEIDSEAKTYINFLEKIMGGKLNRETLKIEKTQPEFKDGDVLFVRYEDEGFIEIFKYYKKNGDLYDHASLTTRTQALDISGRYKICKDEIVEIRLATEEEKEQLFSALAKEGKSWDAEKKQIVDLKPEVELKPFDKVLVRDHPHECWEPALFWKKLDMDSYPYKIVGGKSYKFCISYECNEHLLDTTNNAK